MCPLSCSFWEQHPGAGPGEQGCCHPGDTPLKALPASPSTGTSTSGGDILEPLTNTALFPSCTHQWQPREVGYRSRVQI